MMEIFRFKDLSRWDQFTIPHLHFPAGVPSARVGSLLRARKEAVDPKATNFADLQPITIHFNGQISRRVVKDGRSYSMALRYVRPNDVVLSKIDLKNGAVGVLPSHWPPAVVTSHFAVYEPDLSRVESEYLRLLVQSGAFKKWLWANRSGADGRTEVKLGLFEDLVIPLPPIAEQRALLAAHAGALARAGADEARAAAEEAAARDTFAGALGLAPPPPTARRPVFIARFRDLDRWSHEAALRRTAAGGPSKGENGPRWPIVRLGEVIADLENGWSPQCLDRPAEGDEWGVLKLGAVSFGRYDDAQNKALPVLLQPQPRLEIADGQVLISRANTTRLVGATVHVEGTRPKLMLCDKIFRCVFRPDSPIEPAFVAQVLRTGSVREQIEAGLTGTSPTMKNVSKPALLALTFPLPPPGTQRELVAVLAGARARAAGLRAGAADTRAAARAAFEAAVYGSPDA